MTKDIAGGEIFELYSAARHVADVAEDAQRLLEQGHVGKAALKLKKAEDGAESVAMRLRDAIRALRQLPDEIEADDR